MMTRKRDRFSFLQAMRFAVALLIAVVPCGILFGQQQNVPPMPKLTRLEVNMVTGAVTVHFEPAEKETHYLDPVGTRIYRWDPGASGYQEIASSPIPETSYVDASVDVKNGSYKYAIASYATGGETSKMTDSHATMFLEATYDTCRDRIKLEWNQYIGWGMDFSYYIICRSEHLPIPESSRVGTAQPGTQHFTDKVGRDKRYYYAVQITRNADPSTGRPAMTCWSNSVDIETRKTKAPDIMQIDSVWSLPNANRLGFRIGATANIPRFELIRRDLLSEGKTQWTVLKVVDKSERQFLDDALGANTHGRTRYYHLRALDECGDEAVASDVLNSIVVRPSVNDQQVDINWNELTVREGHNGDYYLHRVWMEGEDTLRKELQRYKHGETLSYTDDLSEFQGKSFTSKFCYWVEAKEYDAGGQMRRVSRSTEACAYIEPSILLPTAIAPLDGGASNKLTRSQFAPLTTFEMDYHISIYDRTGQLIFDAENTPWEGTRKDGSHVPEGAYIYRVTLRAKEGPYPPRTETGYLMVVYPSRK